MKTGLFFGSFNPIHVGHLIIAQYMLNEAKLDRIKFIVSPSNPFKTSDELMDAQLRLKMVTLSISDNPFFEVDDIEFQLPVPSYTAHTLEELKKRHPHDHFSIIMGGDNLVGLENWKAHTTILKYPILVYKRTNELLNPIKGPSNITIYDCPILNISATKIRQMLRQNQSVKYLVRDEIITVLKKEL